MLDLTNVFVAERKQVPAEMLYWQAFPEEWRLLYQQRGDQLHINAHDFGMRYLTSRCPHTFGHVVYFHALLVTKMSTYVIFLVTLGSMFNSHPPRLMTL